MDSTGFKKFIDAVIDTLRTIAISNPDEITSCKSGDDFELCVVKATKQTLSDSNLKAIVHHTPGSHAFPDIVIEFSQNVKYGIEVKSSTASKSKGWKINGNSVMGSTRDDSVIDTYIVFGKTSKNILEFRARRYEECVANVVVTHSPRYLIDMDLQTGETFFEKSGIEYKQMTTSDNPIGLVTAYFQSQGQKAWWLTDSTPAAVRMLNDMPNQEQMECFGYGLAHFPELFERNATKYKRFAMWLVTERSVVTPSLRDDFSAGGQVNLLVNGTAYSKIPQIYKRLLEYKDYMLKALDTADSEALCEDWGCAPSSLNSLDEKIKKWIAIVSSHVSENQLPKEVKPRKLLEDIMYHSDNT